MRWLGDFVVWVVVGVGLALICGWVAGKALAWSLGYGF